MAGRGASGSAEGSRKLNHRWFSKFKLLRFSENLALFAGTIIAVCLAAEVVLRFCYHPENLGAVVRFDNDLGWSLEPDSRLRSVDTVFDLDYWIRVNSLGMREREFSPVKIPGTRRILIVGDSIAFGTGVDAGMRFSDVLDRSLGDDTEVLNAGVCGWGTDQELIYYESIGSRLDPDVVILTLTMANDVINNMLDHSFLGSAPKPKFVLAGDSLGLAEPVLVRPSPPVHHRIRNLLKRSRLLLFVKRRIDNMVRSLAAREVPARKPKGFDRRGLERIYSHWSVYEKTYDERFEQSWRVTQALLDRFSSLCRRDGVDLIVLAFPLKIEVDDTWRRELLQHYRIDSARFDFVKPYRRMADFCQRRDIEFFYPLDRFRQASRSQSLYFEKDTHPNVYGHAVAAKALLETLRDDHDFQYTIAEPDLAHLPPAP